MYIVKIVHSYIDIYIGRKEISMKDIFMDTAKVMSKGQVTIPKRIREFLNLENGDYVTFVVNKDRVEIQNSKVFIEENIGKSRW